MGFSLSCQNLILQFQMENLQRGVTFVARDALYPQSPIAMNDIHNKHLSVYKHCILMFLWKHVHLLINRLFKARLTKG